LGKVVTRYCLQWPQARQAFAQFVQGDYLVSVTLRRARGWSGS
jgi:hypothetical protein